MTLNAVSLEKSRTSRDKVRSRVLVVDDEPLIRWATSSTLSDAGFTVVEASDVDEARRLFESAPVDLVLLDVRLPGGNGLALMQELHGVQPECRFIMMAAFWTAELRTEAAVQHVPVLDKPFAMSDLVGLVRKMMAPQR